MQPSVQTVDRHLFEREVGMTKVVGLLGLVMALGSCVADVAEKEDVTEDGKAEPEEAVGRAQDALRDVGVLTPEEKDAQVEKSLAGWRVYRDGGKDYVIKTRFARAPERLYCSAHPRMVDDHSRLVVMRTADVEEPRRWIHLSLRASWMEGDAYFDRLMERHHLTVIDMIDILDALQKAGEEAPAIETARHEKRRTTDCIGSECGPTVSPWPPTGPDHDHQGPPPGDGYPPPPHPGGPTPVHPGAHPPHPPGVPRHGNGDARKKAAEEDKMRENGLGPDDPRVTVTPSPNDASYTPKRGEIKDTFRCNGQVVRGYKGACPDFQAMPVSKKWYAKLGDFFERHEDRVQRYVFHNVWNDGKNPECMDTCTLISNVDCIGIGGALWLVCIGLTDGLCVAGAAGAVGGTTFTALSPAVCAQMVQKRCATNICIDRGASR